MLENPGAAGKKVAYTVVSRGKSIGKAIRSQRFRYTRWATGEELYDLEADPREETNLAKSTAHRETLSEMRSLLATKDSIAASAKR